MTKLGRRLPDPLYMTFPLSIGADGAATSTRADHVREQIQQVLFTDPGERVFRPEFGAGVRALVFEPNASALWEMTKNRIAATVGEVLFGEVDPKTLRVSVSADPDAPERLVIEISYTLAALGVNESHTFQLGAGS